MKGKGRKIAIASLAISVIVATIVCLANFSKLTAKTLISNINPEDMFFMEYNEFTNSDANFTETPNVTFSAFFARDEKGDDGVAEKYDGTCNHINSKATMFMDLNVMNEGYLKDGATITIQGSNFDYSMFMIKDSILKDNYIGTDITQIKFNKVEPGSEKILFGNIIADIGNDTNNYSNVSKIIFDGTYVDANNVEIPLHKEIELTADWYGTVQTQLYTNGNATYYYDNMTSNQIRFSFTGNEKLNQILLKDAIATATIPTLNGYQAISAEPSVSGIDYEFENGVLTMTKSSVVDGDGIITNALSRSNTFTVNVTYPPEAYEAIDSYTELKVPVTCQYVGYNNPDEQFTDMTSSNIAEGVVRILFTKTPEATVSSHRFDVCIMDKQYVSKPNYRYIMSKQDLLNLYDNADYEGNYEYTVRWYAYSGNAAQINSYTMSETTNNGNAYGDKFDNIVLEQYTANKGIYFANADNSLGENGEIRVYNNDTNELIETFTKDNWNTYNANNVYEYDEAIKHIRVETSNPNEGTFFYVYNVKEFDAKKITEDISKEQMEQISLIYTFLTGKADVDGVGASTTSGVDSAYLVSEISDAKISLSIPRVSSQENNNETIYIDTVANQMGDAKWKNGEFVVEVPQEIINMEVNSVTVDKQDVEILAWDLYKENDKYLIRVITSNENETTYRISINCKITPDSRVGSGNRNFNLYSYNERCNDYYTTAEDIYDVDSDSVTNEQVGKTSCSLELLSPTSLITLETVSDYNDENEITIAPNVAAVEKDKRTAKINLSLRNNYPYTIDGITILGKIPFEGNTYVLQNAKSMNSEFDTSFATAEQLNSNEIGIISSMASVSNNMVVYYSENENPTRDLTDASNGWVASANVQDISKMKTYLVKLNDFQLRQNEEATLYYWVYLPEGLDYNSVSYSDHAVYYDFVTDGGRLPLSTEPAKVGVKIVDKYDLDLTKLKVNSSLTIPSVTYSLTYTDKDTEGNDKEYSRILTTNSNGKITINNLYANITYTLKEVKVPDTCELSDNIVTFMIDENGELHLTGAVKNSSFENNSTLKLSLEDEIKANLQIVKTKNGTSTRINNVRFSLTDSDGNVKSATTQNGVLTLSGLSLNKQYTLKEVSGPNNIELKTGSTKFTLTRTEGGIKVTISENSLGASLINANASNIVAEVDGQSNEVLNPTIEMGIQNEVRYSLELNKKDNLNNAVQGAQFVIKGRGFKVEGSKYTTTRFGTLSISGLYVGSEYTLEEISAPGYYLDSEANNKITFTVSRSGNLVVTSSNGSGITVVGTPTISDDNAESLNPKLNVTVENEKIPTYNLKLIKENDKGENLVGAQFKLKSLDTGKEEALTIEQDSDNMFEGLYEFIADKSFVTGEYELTEMYAPEGYKLDMTPIKFKATRDESTGIVSLSIISGGDNIKIDGDDEKVIVSDEDKVTITIVNKPIFNLIKKGDNDVLLPNAKFTITDLEGNAVTGSDGEIVGTLEGGKYVITTDSEGKITANLPEGFYKAVEVEAPDGYELPENEEDRTYLFGIGASRGAQTSDKIDKLEWARAIGSDYISEFKDVIATQDGGVIAVGSTDAHTYVDGGSSANGYGNQDGIIVKYDANGNIVWQKLFGGRNNDELFAIAEDTKNGGYAVVGYNFAHDENTDTTGNCLKYDGIAITGIGNFGSNDGVVLKITEEGDLSWCQSIGGTRVDRVNAVAVNEDGDVAVTGSFYETIYLDSAKSASITSKGEKDAFISVYDSTGELKWYRSLGSANGDAWGNAITTTSDRGFIVGVNFLGTLQIEGSNSVTVASNGNADGALVAYGADGAYKWYKQIGSSNNDSVYDVIDYDANGVKTIVAVGGYAGAINDYSLDAKRDTFGEYCYDGFIIKFDESGTYRNSITFGGGKDEVISSVVPTKDGGLLFGGWTYSIDRFTFKGKDFSDYISQGYHVGDAANDGFIIELDNEENLVWSDMIQGYWYESVNGIAQTIDGSCFAVGDFNSNSVNTMNKVGALKNVLSYDSDGFVIKYGKSITEAAIPETAEVMVNNELIKHTITTEIGENAQGQRIGGTITGNYTNDYVPSNYIQFVENVKHGYDGQDDIVIKPSVDYTVVEITVNGEKIEFTPDSNGIVTLPAFKNVTEDIHIVAKFATENHTIRVKKVNEEGDVLEGATFEVKSTNDTSNVKTYTGTTDSTGIATIDVEDLGNYQIREIEAPEHYIKSDEVKDIELTSSSKDVLYTFTNRAIPSLIVHRYYKDSNGNYTTIKVAEDEATEGIYDKEYTTNPYATLEGEQINLDGLTLEKVDGEYVTPANAVGTFTNAVTEVTYYFEADPITLTIRHLEEGTDNELAERTVVTQKVDYEFDEEFNHTISSSFDYDLDDNSDYNTLKNEYIYVATTTQSEDENGNNVNLNYTDIGDVFTYSSDSEITYYYNKKVHTITSEVESHKENRTDSVVNTKVEVEVDGGSITGNYNAEYLEANGIKFIETVKDKENALTAVVATPDENYGVEYIELVSIPENGEAVSKVIYGTKTVVDGGNTTVINAETVEGVNVTVDANGVVSVAALENITEDKHFVVRFAPDEGTVTVHYIIKGETPAENVEHSSAVITDLVGEPYATGPISIENYRMIESSNNTNGEYINGNIDVYYYYVPDSYEYSVEYYYDNVLDPAMTESGDDYKAKYEEVISTYPTEGKVKDGYVFDHDEKVPLIVSEDSSLNVIKVYYVKRSDLEYTVHYKEQGTDETLADDKTVGNQTFADTVTENAIDISGYVKVDPTSADIEITTGVNEHTFYYTKRNDLSYTVNYLEKDTNKVLHTHKTTDGQTYKSVITSANEVIDIDGYNYDSVDKDSLTIEVDETSNVINIYYTKRNDLEYTVHYKEQGTEETLADDKEVDGQTFGDTVTESAIDISGYVKVDPTSANIEITTGVNEHTFYYTKRNDLSYTVNYLEKDTNKVLHTPKTTDGQTYKSVITSAGEVIDIAGYNYNSVDKDSLTIEVDETSNVINIYYTKKTDLGYTVHYKEQGTDETVAPDKTVGEQTFGDTVTETAIDVDGYVKVEPTTGDIEITTGTNEHTFYYTKRNDLSYTVNYLEKGSNAVLHDPKTVDNKTFKDEITSADEVIDITGYEYDSLTPETLVIGADSEDNVINIYYKKANFDYTVHYFYDGVEDESKVETKQAEYLSEISTYTDKGEGYVFIEAKAYDSEGRLQDAPLSENPLVIGVDSSKNVINVYYRSAYEITTSVKPHTEHYSDGTTSTVKGGTISGENAPEGYYETVLKGDDSTKDIVIKPDDGYEITRVTITESVIPEGSTVEQIVTRELDIDSFKDASGKITLNTENGYFDTVTSDKHVEVEFKKKTKVIVKYLEKDTLEVLADEVEIPGLEGDEFNPEVVNITGYRTAKVKVSDTEDVSMTYATVIEEDGEEVVVYTKFDPSAENTMFADEVTVICWYEKIPEGTILVKHIEVDENEIENGLTIASGVVLKEESFTGKVETTKDVAREEFTDEVTGRKYISVDGPEGEDDGSSVGGLTGGTSGSSSTSEGSVRVVDGVVVIDSDVDEYTVRYVEKDEDGDGVVDSIEVRFYYEKQYNVTTEVKEHTEMVDDVATEVKGGSISGESQESYEMINNKGANAKSIVATPDEKYRVKAITVNEREINISEFEDASHKVTIPAGYFEQVSEDKHVVVEFEKIPAKVIVKYVDIDTNEEIRLSDTEIGGIGDDYGFERVDIDGYEKAGEEPANAEGVMTEDDITVVFYYKKLPATVVIKYVDIDTKEEIKDSDSLDGHIGEDYETVRAEIEGYEKAGDEPANASGVMDEAEIVVTYYYKKVEEVEPVDEPGDEPGTEPEVKPEDKPEVKPEDEPNVEPAEETSVQPEQPSKNDVMSPQTGDNVMNAVATLVAASLSLVGISIGIGRKKGKQ